MAKRFQLHFFFTITSRTEVISWFLQGHWWCECKKPKQEFELVSAFCRAMPINNSPLFTSSEIETVSFWISHYSSPFVTLLIVQNGSKILYTEAMLDALIKFNVHQESWSEKSWSVVPPISTSSTLRYISKLCTRYHLRTWKV